MDIVWRCSASQPVYRRQGYFLAYMCRSWLIELGKSKAIVVSCWREMNIILYMKPTQNHWMDQLLHKRFTGNVNSASEIKILSNQKPHEIDVQ